MGQRVSKPSMISKDETSGEESLGMMKLYKYIQILWDDIMESHGLL